MRIADQADHMVQVPEHGLGRSHGVPEVAARS